MRTEGIYLELDIAKELGNIACVCQRLKGKRWGGKTTVKIR